MKFIDSVKINLKAGNGGAGFISFFQDWMQKKPRPDGGNGGDGGNIILIANPDLNSLSVLQHTPTIIASNGEDGSKRRRHGKNGEDVYLQVPVGTLVFDVNKTELIFDFIFAGQQFILVEGGKGGLGNAALNSKIYHSAKERQLGTLGTQKTVQLDLRFLADVGLVGLPNVGKTSLLNAFTNSIARVGSYQFTTLNPNLGILKNVSSNVKITIADLPGIIEGAHNNRGLGNRFLKHAERCRLLLHVFDLSWNLELIQKNIKLINDELFKYNHHFQTIPQIFVGNKLDLVVQNNFSVDALPVNVASVLVSAILFQGLEKLKKIIVDQFQNNFSLQTVVEKTLFGGKDQMKIVHYPLEKNIGFKKIGKNTWELSGKVFNDLLKKWNINDPNDLVKFNQQLKESKIDLLLKKEGLKKGDLVYVQKFTFYWQD